MAWENRDLAVGTRLAGNYKKQRYVCTVDKAEEGDGVIFALDERLQRIRHVVLDTEVLFQLASEQSVHRCLSRLGEGRYGHGLVVQTALAVLPERREFSIGGKPAKDVPDGFNLLIDALLHHELTPNTAYQKREDGTLTAQSAEAWLRWRDLAPSTRSSTLVFMSCAVPPCVASPKLKQSLVPQLLSSAKSGLHPSPWRPLVLRRFS